MISFLSGPAAHQQSNKCILSWASIFVNVFIYKIYETIKNKSGDVQAWNAGELGLIFYLWSKYGDHQLEDRPAEVPLSKAQNPYKLQVCSSGL